MVPVYLWPLAWLAGVAWQLQQPALWPQPWVHAALAVAAVLAGVAAWCRWSVRGARTPQPGRARAGCSGVAAPCRVDPARTSRRAHRRWALGAAAAALACALAGAASTDRRAAVRLAERLSPALEGADLELTGVVARLPQASLAGTRFVLDVEAATRAGAPAAVPPRVSLGWFRGPDGDALLLGPDTLRAGERWRLPVRLRAPHATLNPGGFDAELWLFEQGIGATGYVRSRAGAPAGARAERLDAAAGAPIEAWRQAVRTRIFERVSEPAVAGVLAALAIGDQAAIERGDWDVFRATGVAHLVAISGLHITMFAWAAAHVIRWTWQRGRRTALLLPAPSAGRWGGLACATLYAMASGWGVPAQRTLLMLAAVVLLRGLARRWPAPAVLLVAGAAVVVADPWALLQAGFWLSFAAVGVLMMADDAAWRGPPPAAPWRVRARHAVWRALHTQAVATVGLAPLTLLFFRQVSVVGFVANLVAIPLVTLVVTPLALAGIVWPALWLPAAAVVQGLQAFLGALARWPWAQWSAAEVSVPVAALALAGAVLAVMPLPWRLRLSGAALMLPMLAPVPERPAPGRYQLDVLDVGQGTAVLVRTAEHLLVYDTGPSYGPDSDAGQRVLAPVLRARGERRIDRLVLSHRDTDHIGGAAALLGAWPVGLVVSSLASDHPLRLDPRAPHTPCRAGERWLWDGVAFEWLHPADPQAPAVKSNARSCVLRITAGQGATLLTGDIEQAQEAALVERWGDRLASAVLVVPHHGSRTSSTRAFIAAVAPRVALVQAGYRSRFGHPAADVVERYEAAGAVVVRSDRCGAWHWRGEPLGAAPPQPSAGSAGLATKGAGLAPTGAGLAPKGAPACWREAAARYWHHRPDSSSSSVRPPWTLPPS